MSEFNTDLPSVRRLQTFTKDKTQVEIKLLTNDVFTGIVAWQDPNCVCLQDQNSQQVLVWRTAIVYIRPK